MMLNAKQIINGELLKLEHSKGKAAQVGYDLSLKEVNRIGVSVAGEANTIYADNKIGKVLKDKTELATYTPVETIQLGGVQGWLLYQGVYDITFHEGCKIPANLVGLIRQRSSLLRNGTVLHSSVFDPGFETEFMGTVMVVNETIFIEDGARVAQIYFHECTPVDSDNLYNGQWQGDAQRNA
jgi:deoxycytidine triphosphate deaminase